MLDVLPIYEGKGFWDICRLGVDYGRSLAYHLLEIGFGTALGRVK
jgi:hypothetical protein